MKLIIYIIVFTCFLFSNCRKEFIIDGVSVPHELVVNCVFTADSVFDIRVSKLQNIDDTDNPTLTNAIVILYEDNVFLENIPYNSTSETYVSTNTVQIGKTYKLVVNVEGYPEVSAVDKVPESISIDSANVYISYYYDSWEERHLEKVDLYFNNSGEKNYYEVICYRQYNSDSDPFFELSSVGITSIDPIIIAEGILDNTNYLPTLIFSDQKLNEHVSISFLPSLQLASYSELSRPDSYVVLRNISENYYHFQKSWYQHVYNEGLINMNGIENFSDMSFIPDPTGLFSNINNGLGIFASYIQSIILMTVKQ